MRCGEVILDKPASGTRATTFSVATPVRNGMPAIRRCIGSLKGQICAERDPVDAVRVEHVVRDGGSTDGTVALLEGNRGTWECCCRDGSEPAVARVSAEPPGGAVSPAYSLRYRSAPDDGMYDAINQAWAETHGDVLSWLNADEQYLPGTLARVAVVFREDPEVDAVFGNFIIVGSDGAPIAARRDPSLRRRHIASTFLNAASCTMFFRRSLYRRGLLRLDRQYRYSADKELVLRLLEAGVRFAYVNEYLALFQMTGHNLTSSPEMQQESDAVGMRFGGSRRSAVRMLRRGLKWGEKAMRGCYWPARVNYAYTLDEKPRYSAYVDRRVGFRVDSKRWFGRRWRPRVQG